MRIVRVEPDGAWTDVAPGAVGVLAISGPTVFPGYVTGRTGAGHLLDGMGKLVDGWLDTGDLARLDEGGFIYLTGRAKDLIIRGGHNIDPAMIEDALLAHPQVTAAGAVGRPDVHAGEVPVAYVTLAPGETVTAQELRDFAVERVAERAAATKAITVLDAIPVTAVGKPHKLALRADATRQAVAEALAAFPGAEIGAAIEDGPVVTTVTVSADTDAAAVAAVVDRYPLRWQVVVRSDTAPICR